jgi:uncharacterized protein (DUF1778 family)
MRGQKGFCNRLTWIRENMSNLSFLSAKGFKFSPLHAFQLVYEWGTSNLTFNHKTRSKSKGETTMSKQPNRNRGESVRETRVTIRMTAHERELLRQRMAQANATSINKYMITCTLFGEIRIIALNDFIAVRRLMNITSTNINQIARKLNEGGTMYGGDIEVIQDRQSQLEAQLTAIADKLNGNMPPTQTTAQTQP